MARPTVVQCAHYLQGLAEGKSSKRAAQEVGTTGSRFRTLRKNYPRFDAMCLRAEEAQEDSRVDGLADLVWERVKTSDRVLLAMAEAYLPAFGFRRVRRSETSGQVDVLHRLQLDPEKLAALPPEQLMAAIEALEAAAKDPADVIPLRQLTAGDGKA